MKILVTGSRGRLGSHLVGLLTTQGHEVTGATSELFNVADFAAVKEAVFSHHPELIIHPAAWTDVDGCAREPERALLVNGFGAQNIAVAAAELGAAVLYISSNEVFDGQAKSPYREYDTTHPANPYGYSKWVGERAVMSLNPRHYVVRTSWLFAHGGKNFIQTVLNLARQGSELRVVTDEVANPTYNDDLAEAVAKLVTTGRYGVYHFVNSGACSRYTFARFVLDHAGFDRVPITPITRHQWPRPSIPPLYSSLANLAGSMLGITLRPWQDAISAFLQRENVEKSLTS